MYSFWSAFSGPTLPSCMSSVNPMMELRGVRSSWDMFARNSLFSRLASCTRRYCSSSSSFFLRSWASRRFWSVMSRAAANTPRSFPSAPLKVVAL